MRENQKVTRKCWNNNKFFRLGQPDGPIEEVLSNEQPVPLKAVSMEDIMAEDWVLFDPWPSDPKARAELAAAQEEQRLMDEAEAQRNQYYRPT